MRGGRRSCKRGGGGGSLRNGEGQAGCGDCRCIGFVKLCMPSEMKDTGRPSRRTNHRESVEGVARELACRKLEGSWSRGIVGDVENVEISITADSDNVVS